MPVNDGSKLTNPEELQLRQVIPIWIQEGRPSSCAFTPNSGDGGQCSLDRNSVVTPREAFEAYLARQRSTGGCWGVSVGEYSIVELSDYSDPLQDNAAHSLVDFSGHPEGAWRRLGKRIKKAAQDRGCLHPNEENE